MIRKCNDRPSIIGRWICAGFDLAPELEATSDRVWLTRSCCCDRYTIKGVPAKRVDVLIDDTWQPGDIAIVEVARKSGRFDGAIRDRITIRSASRAAGNTTAGEQARAMDLILGGDGVFSLSIERSDDGTHVRITIGDPADPCWRGEWGCLRYVPTGSDCARFVQWHATRYYPMLGEDEVDRIATEAPLYLRDGATLAEVNRMVSRLLYEAARQAGWRKLTLREQERLGLSGQWHRDEVVLAALAGRRGCAAGVGEATIRAGHCEPGDAPEGFDLVFRRAM